MERCFKVIFFTLLVLLFPAVFSLYSQVPSQEDQLRIQLWTDIDDFPGIFDGFGDDVYTPSGRVSDFDESIFTPAIGRLKEMAPFLLNGMLNGWSYDYVPYDKTRRVSEFFEMEELVPFNAQENPISWHSSSVQDGKLVVWAYCNRTEAQKAKLELWNSIVHPKVHGTGRGDVEDGFEGIKKAAENAVKNAVREYWRIYEKNKPKEILGSVLLTGTPRIYVEQGEYVVELDFFMETDKIIKYTQY